LTIHVTVNVDLGASSRSRSTFAALKRLGTGSGTELAAATVAAAARRAAVNRHVHNVERRQQSRPNSTFYIACVHNVEPTRHTAGRSTLSTLPSTTRRVPDRAAGHLAPGSPHANRPTSLPSRR